MLGAEERFQFDFRSFLENVDCGFAVSVNAGVVSDQADLELFDRSEILFRQYIDAVEDFGMAGTLGFAGCDPWRKSIADVRIIKTVDSHGCEGCDTQLQREDIASTVRMNAIGEENPKGFRKRIDPHRVAGETGVTVRADGKELAARPAITCVDVPTEAAASVHAFAWSDADSRTSPTRSGPHTSRCARTWSSIQVEPRARLRAKK